MSGNKKLFLVRFKQAPIDEIAKYVNCPLQDIDTGWRKGHYVFTAYDEYSFTEKSLCATSNMCHARMFSSRREAEKFIKDNISPGWCEELPEHLRVILEIVEFEEKI